ncbi:hypothetical protein Tco_1175723 [Tanacetum coccineum]
MHNNIMQLVQKIVPPMLGPGRYSQWLFVEAHREHSTSSHMMSKGGCGQTIERQPQGGIVERTRVKGPICSGNFGSLLLEMENPWSLITPPVGANPLALLAAAHHIQNNYYQAPNPQRSECTHLKHSSSHDQVFLPAQMHKRSPKTSYSSIWFVSEEDSDQNKLGGVSYAKNLALLAKYFIRSCTKPTNNNLRPRNARKPKRVKTTRHKEMMMMCKQVDKESRSTLQLHAIIRRWSHGRNQVLMITPWEQTISILDLVHCFIHELKREMNDDLEYVNSLEKELDELESEKADFSNIYDLLLEEYCTIHLFIVDSGCTKHMTAILKLLCNFCGEYLWVCPVHFGNGPVCPILGYGD